MTIDLAYKDWNRKFKSNISLLGLCKHIHILVMVFEIQMLLMFMLLNNCEDTDILGPSRITGPKLLTLLYCSASTYCLNLQNHLTEIAR